MKSKQAEKLFNKDFVLLWQGQAVSQIGTQVASIALIFWIKQSIDLASLVGISVMIFTLTFALFTPVGGTIADRFSRKKIFIISDIVCGIASLLLAYFMFRFADDPLLVIAIIFVVQFIFGLARSFFNPAIFASVPDIVPEKDLTKANSMRNSTRQIAVLIGQGAGGLFFKLLGGPLIFLINGLTYLFSAISECFIKIPQKTEKKDHNSSLKESLASFFNETWSGIMYLWEQQGMRRVLLMFALLNFFISPYIILLPFYVEDFLGIGPEWYGYLMGGFGGGTALGYVLVSTLNFSGKLRSWIVAGSLVVFSLISAGYGFIRIPILALVLFVFGGVILGFFTIVFETSVQLKTESEMRGRVSGAINFASQGLIPLGMGLFGIIADLVNQNIPLIFLVCGIALFMVTMFTFTKKESYQALTYD